MAWLRCRSSGRVFFFSICGALFLVGAYVTLTRSHLYSSHPRVGGFAAASTQWKRDAAQDEGLKHTIYRPTESSVKDLDSDSASFESLSRLFRKLHALDEVLAMQKEGGPSRSSSIHTSEKALLEEYKKIKRLVSWRLKNSVNLSYALDHEHPAAAQSVSQKSVDDQSNTIGNVNIASQLAAVALRRPPRIALCSFPLAEQIRDSNLGVPSLRDRDLVIILTTMRSGSSFFGQLLERSDDVLYFYEPLKGLARQAAIQNFTDSDQQKLQLNLLQSISTCNFNTRVGQQLLQDISLSAYSSRANSHTFVSPPLCPHDCEPTIRCPVLQSHIVQQVCMSKKATVVKTIRIRDIRWLKQLADLEVKSQSFFSGNEMPARLKVAHLVRDPRAVVFSKMRIRGMLQKDYIAAHGQMLESVSKTNLIESEAETLCTEMLSNLQYAATQPDWLRGRYHIYRFEDIALAVESRVTNLYHHFGLEISQSVMDWIDQNTKADMNLKKTNPYATSRNSELVVTAWRVLLKGKEGQSIVKIIESRCQHVMNFLGYKFVNEQFFVGGQAAQHAPNVFMNEYTRE